MSPKNKLKNEALVSEAGPSSSMLTPKIEQVIELNENGGNKRKLPSWQSPNKNIKTNDREIDVKDEKYITNDIARVAAKTQISKSDGKECISASVNDQIKGLLVHDKGRQHGNAIGPNHNQSLKRAEGSQISSKMEDLTMSGSSRKQKGQMLLESPSQSKDALQQNLLIESKQIQLPFEKFLDGVIFALSGLVNPERANIREKALQMGAQYRPDWTSDCTLLVCAFANTPKFNQVMNDNGSIVSKDWILDCYQQKELLEIDNYLMHAGRPWRKFDVNIAKNAKSSSDSGSDEPMLTIASLQEVQTWVHGDVAASIAWLKQQENQHVENITNTWDFVPRAVRELAVREEKAKCTGKANYFADLLSEAERLKWIYSTELNKLKFGKDTNRTGDTRDKMSDGLASETDSEATEILEEDDIVQAKETIKKLLANESVMR